MTIHQPSVTVPVAAVEPLETRLLFAAEPSVLRGHTLVIQGNDSNPNTVELRLDSEGRNVQVVWPGDPTRMVPESFATAAVRRIKFTGGTRADNVTVVEAAAPFALPVTMNGQDGEDVLIGGSGADTIRGGDGNDIIFGADKGDRLYGGIGNDVIRGGTGSDRIHGGEGIDAIDIGSFGTVAEPANAMWPPNTTPPTSVPDDDASDAWVDWIDGGRGDDVIEVTTRRGKVHDHVTRGAGNDAVIDLNKNS